MKKFFLLISAVLVLTLISCSKKEKLIEEAKTPEVTVTNADSTTQEDSDKSVQALNYDMKEPESLNLVLNTINLSGSPSRTNAKAHAKYLKDELKFGELDSFGLEQTSDCKTAVVGSEVCELYSPDNFTLKEVDGEKRWVMKNPAMKGTPIPLGTIIKIDPDGTIRNGDTEEWYSRAYGYYYFGECYNFFYKAEYNGKTGYVYGADLIARYDGLDYQKVISMLYRTNGVPQSFYPVAGSEALSENVKKSLVKNRLAIQDAKWPDYPEVDDFINSYTELDKITPVFITTDLIAHSQHKIFDKLLADTEENFFIPRLLEITKHFISALEARTDLPEDVKEKAINYFQVPEICLRMAPVQEYDDWGRPSNEKFPDKDAILSEYSDKVVKDYNSVMNLGPRSETAIFETREDFTQYKPRGHYTKNGRLEAYFRAQMWFGRIHFCIAKSGFNPKTDDEMKKMLSIAMAITDTVKNNPDLYKEWEALFDPITELIGMADDLSFADVLPIWKEQNVTDFSEWASDVKNYEEIVRICHERLRPPAISGNSVFLGPSEDGLKPPMGWRFLGQRFTYDSNVHQQVCAPTIYSRDFVRGLDIMKVFGSKTAELLLKDDYEKSEINGDVNHFYGGKELKETLNELQSEYSKFDEKFWTQTYYTNVLATIKAQANFEQGQGFYFTESPLWSIKALNAAHSTWAELRHDTILYVKQVYAERAGGDDLEPTYRTKPVPSFINYIEPDLDFWKYSLLSIDNLTKIMNKYNLIDASAKTKLNGLYDIYSMAYDIVLNEISDKPISEKENNWIRTIPSSLTRLIVDYSGYIDGDEKKMACVADVFTNTEFGVVLEVGVGPAKKIYVPLNDGHGGKRIAVGFIPSYYEFYHSMGDRLTDEQWKQTVYNEKDLSAYEPFWKANWSLPKDN